MSDARDDLGGLAQLHRALLEAIVDGRLAPGATVSQVQLAKQMGVSRTPLREALRLLERDGFVHAETNRRVVVTPLSVVELEDIYAMRIGLETLAIHVSVPALAVDDVAAMGDDLVEMVRCAADKDYDGWRQPHGRFHARLTSQAGPQVRRSIDQLSMHAERYRRAHTTQIPMAWERGLEEHRDILRAVEAGDARQAAIGLARHYARVALSTVALLAPEHDPKTVRAALNLVLTAPQPALA